MGTSSRNTSSFKRIKVGETQRKEFSDATRPYKRSKPKARSKYVKDADAFNKELLNRANILENEFTQAVASAAEVKIINAQDALKKIEELGVAKADFIQVIENKKDGISVTLIEYTRVRGRLQKAVVVAQQGFDYLKKVAQTQQMLKKNSPKKPKLKRKPITKKGGRSSK